MSEIVVPFRTLKPSLVTAARSTLLVSAMQALRARGLYERYVELIAPNARNEIMSLVAGVWIPGEVALEHYRTMDRLGLTASEIEAIGAEVNQRGSKTVLKRTPASEADRTPWKMFELLQRNLDSNWRGSDMMVIKEGPKEAVSVWEGQPCASVPYFVTSWGAFMRTATNRYATSAQHRVLKDRSSPTTIAISLTWV